MKTKRMISTVGYNTRAYLDKVCNELVSIGAIEWWFAVYHKPELDETKAHWHMVLQPSATLDTASLRKQFDEPDPGNDLPLGVLPFRYTKSFTDWYLYAIHHKGYLLWKGETRKHHYTFDDVVGSDLMLLHELTSEADMSKYRCYELIFLAAERKIKFSSLVADGVVPLHLINQFRTLYECILEDGTFRGGRVSHFDLSDGDLGPFK